MVEKHKPFINIGPGDIIREDLKSLNWTQKDLAAIMEMSDKAINEIINNKSSINIDTARLLSKAFGQSPQFWISADTNYRLRLEEETQKENEAETKALIFKYMPIKEMIKKGWLNDYKNVDELINAVKSFWDIKEIDFLFMDKLYLPNFRKSDAYQNYKKYYAYAWFKMAQKCSRFYRVNSYNKKAFESLILKFHKYTLPNYEIKTFLSDLNSAGVKFFVLSHLPKTYIDGATFWDGDNPVIVYSARLNRIDNFWFTIAHEISHILLHLKQRDKYFIDTCEKVNSKIENQADKSASKMIKADDILSYFKPFGRYISDIRVKDCANTLNVGISLVVGVLQYHNILSKSNLNRYKKQIIPLIPQNYFAEKTICRI